jgi:hypothetical protein
MTAHIRTHLCDAQPPEPNSKKKEVRYWNSVELLSPTSFIVDTCVGTAANCTVTRWVTASIEEAARIQKNQAPYRWSQVFLFVRTPMHISTGLIFSEVEEAFEDCNGDIFYRLSNGSTFIIEHETTEDISLQGQTLFGHRYTKPRQAG